MAAKKPLVIIVGPTASGKTGLAIDIAKKHDGEVIAADSRTVYTGMDIGTAKPTLVEQQGIPHWGFDLATPADRRFNAAQFQQYAKLKIKEITSRDKLPILVGGTGLYVDAVVFDYQFPKPMDSRLRNKLETMNRDELYKYCIENNVELPVDDKNARRLIKQIADPKMTAAKSSTISCDTIIVGVVTDKSDLESRIRDRTEQMFDNGVVDEARILGEKYGWDTDAMKSNVYRDVKPYLEGNYDIHETKLAFQARDWQLARRQMTWFRRNPHVMWCLASEAREYVDTRIYSHGV